MKCLAIGLPAVDAYIETMSNKFNIPAKDVKTFTELYINKNNTNTLPTLSQFVAFLEAEKLIPETATSQPQTPTNVKIDFQEEPTTGYRERTIKNASADATIAIAVDFTSAGEKLTKSSVLNQNKKYIPIDVNEYLSADGMTAFKIVQQLNSANAKSLNIAGNGIYTMKGKYTQEQIDTYTYELLKAVVESPNLKNKITSIRTGGQTGFDEAGAKAGIKLGIPTSILAPKGWKFRNTSGADISNEQEFKARFANIQSQVSANLPGPETKINIYAGTGENAELSNFANRPFEYNTKTFPRETVKFKSVEQAFQFMKLAYSPSSVKNESIANKILETTNGKTLRDLGKDFDMKKDGSWDRNSSRIMKELLLDSFKQNPKALQTLLATGNATLTHTQESPKSKWRGEFPTLLMEVRKELGGTQPQAPVAAPIEKNVSMIVNGHVTTEATEFEKTDLLEEQEQLDYLQAVFYNLLETKAVREGVTITKEFLKNNFEGALNLGIPFILKTENLKDIERSYSYLKVVLVASRLKNIGLSYEEADENVGDRNSGVESKSSVMFNTIELAKDEVVYMFNTLFSDKMIYGTKIPYEYSDSMHKTMNLLGGSTTIEQQIRLLQNSDLPFKDLILNKLGVIDGEQQNTAKYWKVRNSFFENFSKAKSEFHIADLGYNGNTINTIDSGLKMNIKAEAKSAFLQSPYVKINNRGKTVIASIKELSPLTPLEFLNVLGFNIEEADLNEEIGVAAHNIRQVLLDSRNKNVSWVDDKDLNTELKGYLNTILDVLVTKAKKERVLMTRNAEGESQSSVHNHSYFTRKVNALKEKFIKPTNMLEEFIASGVVRYTIISGAVAGKYKSIFNKLSKVDLYSTAITNMFSNGTFVFALPRTSDKSLEQGIEIKRDKSIKDEQGKNITERAYMSKYIYNGSNPKAFIADMFDEYNKDLSSNMPEKFTENFQHPKTYWEQMFKEEPVDPYTEEEFTAKFSAFINASAKEVFDDMTEIGSYALKTKGNNGEMYVRTSIPTAILNKFSPSDSTFRELDSEDQLKVIKTIARAYTLNSVYYGTLLAKTLYGNITGTKTPADFFKRSSSAIAETRSPNLSADFVNWLVANRHVSMKNFPNTDKLRVKITTETITSSDEALLGLTKNIVKGKNPYEKNNVDDGQGKIHFGIYREINMLINNWTDSQEAVYNLLMDGKEIPDMYKKVTFPPLKPVGFDVIDDNGVAVPVFLKLAAYPLIPGAIKGTMNEENYKLMVSEGIGLSGPSSIIKMARPKGKPEYSNGTAEADEDSTFDMNMQGFGIQVDINPKTSFKQLQGTQYRKLIQSNLVSNGISEEAAKKWIKDNNELIEKLATMEKQSLFDEIYENGDVNGKINDAGIKNILRNQLLQRGASSNNVSAISYIFDGATKFIDAVPNRKKLMNIINSMVTNNVIRLFTNGSTLVQVSQTGWELKPGSTVDSETGIDFVSKQAKQNYIDNNGLKFISWEEGDKKVGAAEILLPAKFNQFIKKDKNGVPIKDKDGYYVIDDEKCLVNIGYRIPTQGLNSILHLKVVGFLPSYMEQVIVMPKEITTQGGSDFDVDKVNLYVPNTIRYKGKVVYVDQSIVDRAEEIYQARFEKNTANWDDAFMSKIDEGTTEDAIDYANSKVKALSSLENFKKELQKQALQNDLISQSLQILENGELTLKQLLTPNSSDILSGLAEKLYGKDPKFNYGTLFTPKTLVDITRQMYAAKALVGVFAAQSVHHALGQQVGLHFNSSRAFYFNHNKVMVNGMLRPSLSGIYKYDGITLISEMLGNQYLTAAVDAAKDPFLFLLNVNGLTANAVCAFERMGGDTEYLMSMLKVPIIQKYLSLLENNDSISFKYSALKKSQDSILEETLEKFNKKVTNSEYFATLKNNKSKAGLSSRRATRGNFTAQELQGELTDEEQLMILDDFLFLDKAGKLLSKSISVSKFDVNGGGKDGIQTALILNNYDTFLKDSQDYDKGITLNTIKDNEGWDYSPFIENTLVKTFKDNTEEVTDALYNNMLFLNSNDDVKQLLFKFNDPNEGISIKKLSEDDADALYEGILNYIVQNKIGLDKNLLVGRKSVGARVIKIQQDPTHPLHNTYIFKKLFSVESSDREGAPNIITLKDKFIDVRKQEMLEKEFNEIKVADPELFNDLVTISFFQSGFTQSPASFNQLLNSKITIDIINPILTQFSQDISINRNVLTKIAANIGLSLTNLITNKLKKSNSVFGSQISLGYDKCQGKKLIQVISYSGKEALMYQLNERLSDPEEGVYVYDPIPANNIRTLFSNYTTENLELEREDDENSENEEDNLTAEEAEVVIPVDTIAKNIENTRKIKMAEGTYEVISGQLYLWNNGVKAIPTADQANRYLANVTKNTITDRNKNMYYVLPKNISALKDSKGDRVTEILDSKLNKIPNELKKTLLSVFKDEINKIAKELYLNNC